MLSAAGREAEHNWCLIMSSTSDEDGTRRLGSADATKLVSGGATDDRRVVEDS